MSRQRIIGALLVYLVVVLFVLVWFGSHWLVLRQLSLEGVEIEGTLVETRCSDHDAIFYSYAAGGQTYRSRGHGGYGNLECRELKPGDLLRIWYLPKYPSRSIAGDPIAWKRSDEMGMVAATIWFGIPFAVYILRELRRPKPAVAR